MSVLGYLRMESRSASCILVNHTEGSVADDFASTPGRQEESSRSSHTGGTKFGNSLYILLEHSHVPMLPVVLAKPKR